MAGSLDWMSSLFGWFLRASWQGSILIGLVMLMQWLSKKRLSIHGRYGLWFLVLFRLSVPISMESPISVFNLPGMDMKAGIAQPVVETPRGPLVREPVVGNERVKSEGEIPRRLPRNKKELPFRNFTPSPPIAPDARNEAQSWTWRSAVALLWLLGIALLTLQISWSCYRLHRQLRLSQPVIDGPLLKLLDECGQELGLRRKIHLMRDSNLGSPALFGLFRPQLLLPEKILSGFTAEELRFIILHELHHARRCDIAVNWLVALVQILHWMNPFVWLALRRLRADRELSCDTKVLSALRKEETVAYGRTIVKLLEGFARTVVVPSLVGILEDKNQMRRRIRMIARFKQSPRRWSWPAFASAVILACVTLTDAKVHVATSINTPARIAAAEEQQREILLRVLDAESGIGIPGASLNGKYFTDQSGNCVIPLSSSINLLVRADGYVPQALRFRTRVFYTREYEIRLERGQTLGGIILGQQGNPIQGVEIRVGTQQTERGDGRSLGSQSTVHTETSNSEGRWTCTEIPVGTPDIYFKLVHPEHIETLYITGAVPANHQTREEPRHVELPELKAQTAKMVMRPGLTIAGHVFDMSGKAIEGARISQGYSWVYGPYGKTRTSADGRYTFQNGNLGKMTLTVEAVGFTPKWKTFEVFPEMGAVNFYLDHGRILRGQVVDDSGAPIEGASVRTSGGPFKWKTLTNGDGRFLWNSAPAEPVWITVAADGFAAVDGYHSVDSDLLKLGDGDMALEFSLPRASGLSGTVILSDGQPVVGAEVILLGDPLFGVALISSELARQKTDSSGSFTFHSVSNARRLVATHGEGYGETAVDKAKKNQRVVLQPWGRVEGSLWLNGQPAPNETIALTRGGSPDVAFLQASKFKRRISTDRRGRYEFDRVAAGTFIVEDVPPGSYLLNIHIPGFPSRTFSHEVIVPEKTEGIGTEPLDLGIIRIPE